MSGGVLRFLAPPATPAPAPELVAEHAALTGLLDSLLVLEDSLGAALARIEDGLSPAHAVTLPIASPPPIHGLAFFPHH